LGAGMPCVGKGGTTLHFILNTNGSLEGTVVIF
jgi:hypothetical protein